MRPSEAWFEYRTKYAWENSTMITEYEMGRWMDAYCIIDPSLRSGEWRKPLPLEDKEKVNEPKD